MFNNVFMNITRLIKLATLNDTISLSDKELLLLGIINTHYIKETPSEFSIYKNEVYFAIDKNTKMLHAYGILCELLDLDNNTYNEFFRTFFNKVGIDINTTAYITFYVTR